MNTFSKLKVLIVLALFVAFGAQARDQIKIVGSSTVFPFSTAVAESFGRNSAFKTPVVESTGSGGGLKLFCSGIGNNHPDITNASRRIKSSEINNCQANGITPIEVVIGFDGIVFANSNRSPNISLTRQELYMALAKMVFVNGKVVENPYTNWQQINPRLPNTKIEILGPPPTSGTRDAFVELAMDAGAREFAELKTLRGLKDHGEIKRWIAEKGLPMSIFDALVSKKGNKLSGKDVFKLIAHGMREDGHFIEAGENDNLIIQKLSANPNAFGIFGFSFLEENIDSVQGSIIGGKEPTFENIASGDYPVSRSLYFYVKKEHLNLVPGIKEFVAEFTDEDTWGDEGYLVDKGLIPLTESERDTVKSSVNAALR